MQLTNTFHTEVREALSAIVRILVVDKARVRVSVSLEEGTALYEICVAKSDLGNVIGRQGRTARALRVLIVAASQSKRSPYRLAITSPEDIRSSSPANTMHGDAVDQSQTESDLEM